MRIPITMCHGNQPTPEDKPLTAEHFDRLMKIAAELQFQSINYDELAAWRAGVGRGRRGIGPSQRPGRR